MERTHKYLYMFLSIAVLTAYAFFAYATPPATQYNAGEVLDPVCAPNSSNCSVAVPWLTDQVNEFVYSNNTLHDNALIFGDSDTTWSSGEETKLFFDRANKAFRVGSIDDTKWDVSSVGNRSIAMGFANTGSSIAGPIASGQYSIAIGSLNQATGTGSLAIGYNARATATRASAIGTNVRAFSFQETAIGSGATSYVASTAGWDSDDRSFNVGQRDGSSVDHDLFTILKNGNAAIGIDNWEADADAAAVKLKVNGGMYFGQGDLAWGGAGEETKMFFDPVNQVIRMGSVIDDAWENTNTANVGTGSIAIGFADPVSPNSGPIASGAMSMAFGVASVASNTGGTALLGGTASGQYSLAWSGTASGASALALGGNSVASNTNAMAFNAATASGPSSFAIGGSTVASGSQAVALSGSATASGAESMALGFFSTASGQQSATLGGIGAVAPSIGEVAIGLGTSYTTSVSGATAFNSADRLFTVGNSGHDTLMILKSSLVGIGIDNFEDVSNRPGSAQLYVGGAIQQSAATSCTLAATVDGVIVCMPSDENLKKNITDSSYGLDTVMRLRPVTYQFKDAKFGSGPQIGFIAQDLESIIPEVVTDGPEYKSVNYGLITSVLTKAIQELNLKIESIDAAAITVVNDASFTGLRNWFADAANGIEMLYARIVNADEVNVKRFCVVDDAGEKTCVTKSQLDELLTGNNIDQGGDSESPDTVEPGPNDPQTDENQAPVPDPEPETAPEPEVTP